MVKRLRPGRFVRICGQLARVIEYPLGPSPEGSYAGHAGYALVRRYDPKRDRWKHPHPVAIAQIDTRPRDSLGRYSVDSMRRSG